MPAAGAGWAATDLTMPQNRLARAANDGDDGPLRGNYPAPGNLPLRPSEASSVSLTEAYERYAEKAFQRGLQPDSFERFREAVIDAGIVPQRQAGRSVLPGVELFADQSRASLPGLFAGAVGSDGGNIGKAHGPEPVGLLPKAEAMGGHSKPQGGGVSMLDDTYRSARQSADDAFAQDIRQNRYTYFDDWEQPELIQPTIVPERLKNLRAERERLLSSGHIADPTLRAERRSKISEIDKEMDGLHESGGDVIAIGDQTSKAFNSALFGGLDEGYGQFTKATAAALEAAARASGRELAMYPGGFGASHYGTLVTPSGAQYKVRASNHPRTSALHSSPDFNVAPGALTPDDFIRLLPTLYADQSRASLPGLFAGDEPTQDPELMRLLQLYGMTP